MLPSSFRASDQNESGPVERMGEGAPRLGDRFCHRAATELAALRHRQPSAEPLNVVTAEPAQPPLRLVQGIGLGHGGAAQHVLVEPTVPSKYSAQVVTGRVRTAGSTGNVASLVRLRETVSERIDSGQILFDRVPDEIVIHVIVSVDQPVSHSDYVGQGNFGRPACVSEETRDAASPTISMHFKGDKRSMRSVSRSAR